MERLEVLSFDKISVALLFYIHKRAPLKAPEIILLFLKGKPTGDFTFTFTFPKRQIKAFNEYTPFLTLLKPACFQPICCQNVNHSEGLFFGS